MLTDESSDILRRSAAPRRYRSIFISDVHLGFRGCKADCLLDFLRHVESDHLYLVGDIVDSWRLRKTCVWPEPHREVLRRLLARAGEGTAMVYLPGNHDEELRPLLGRTFRGVRILHEVVHETADGRRLLVTHGDLFDGVARDMRWRWWDRWPTTRRWCSTARSTRCGAGSGSAIGRSRPTSSGGSRPRSASSTTSSGRWSPRRAGGRCAAWSAATSTSPRCGRSGGVLYVNDGDWVKSCSALVEHGDGRLELLYWAGERGLSPAPVPAVAAARPAVAA